MAEAVGRLNRRLVVGYGNELRSDDGLGPFVAEGLREASVGPGAELRVLALPQLDVSLVPELAEVGLAIFIDARRDDDPTSVTVFRVPVSEQPLTPTFSSHTVGLGQLLRAALEWYGAAPRCYVVAPKGYTFDIGDTLSEPARQGAQQAHDAAARLLLEPID